MCVSYSKTQLLFLSKKERERERENKKASVCVCVCVCVRADFFACFALRTYVRSRHFHSLLLLLPFSVFAYKEEEG